MSIINHGETTLPRTASRTDLDVATGIVVALRRTTPDAAAAELLGTASGHRLSVFQLSRALIALVAGSHSTAFPTGAVRDVAELQWGPFSITDVADAPL